MRFSRLNLHHFRNTDLVALNFHASKQFLLGKNGQGKTNILEALAYLSSLRSFRIADNKCLIHESHPQAQLFYEINHEIDGPSQILINLHSSGRRSIELNGNKISKVSQIIGKFPTTVLSSEDIQWLRGAPAYRRRFLDLTLASIDPLYLSNLRKLHKALNERNALLRSHNHSNTLIKSYDSLLAPLAFQITHKRAQLIHHLNHLLAQYYQKITLSDHSPEIQYQQDCILDDSTSYLHILEKNLQRDTLLKSTQKGPHRDDFVFKHTKKLAKLYASEGQQRTLVLALRLAQAQYFQEKLSINPVILADDVLGQLDPDKAQRFWSALNPNLQIIATGTTPPSSNSWQTFLVHQGACTSTHSQYA